MTVSDEILLGRYLILYPLAAFLAMMIVVAAIKEGWKTLTIFVAAWRRNRRRKKPVDELFMNSEDIVNNFIRRKKLEQEQARNLDRN